MTVSMAAGSIRIVVGAGSFTQSEISACLGTIDGAFPIGVEFATLVSVIALEHALRTAERRVTTTQ